MPSATRPQAPTSASQGLTRRSGSAIDRPRTVLEFAREAVMQALEARVFFASLRSRSENSRHSAMLALHTQGCSMRLNQPMKRVSDRRGMRLVSRKLMSSCCNSLAMMDSRSSYCHSPAIQSAPGISTKESSITAIGYALAASRRGVPAAQGLQRDCSCRVRSIARSRVIRAWRAALPRWCRSTSTTRRASSAPMPRRRRSRRRGAPASCGLSALYAERFQKTAALTADVAGGVSDLQFTSRYRVPFQFSGFVRRHFKAGSFVESSSGVDGHRSGRQSALRSDRLLRRQCVRLRLLQGVHRARQRAGARSGAGARRLSSGHRLQRAAPAARFPVSTRFPFTCPAPRRSCRRCGWRATTPGAPTWCASAAPITAGGAMCSPASATRSPRAIPTR